ncbi:MAG: hypothetical protein KKD31_18390, partial [Bacteroidetes bacterium]|nr:hypothetical protein [Bacteroidota bacterium]
MKMKTAMPKGFFQLAPPYKKLIINTMCVAASLIFTVSTSFAQQGVKWATGGIRALDGDFLGTTNPQPIVFKVDNTEVMRLIPEGRLGIGTTTPETPLHVVGDVTITGKLFLNGKIEADTFFMPQVASVEKLITSRISSPDSVIFFGDSTITLDLANNALSWASGLPGNRRGFSIGVGENFVTSGMYSMVIGTSNNTASGAFSMVIGRSLTASAVSSMVIGEGAGKLPLVNSIPHSLAIGFNSTIPTFFVGRAAGAGQTGNVGIGTTQPNAKLDVNGDLRINDNTLWLRGGTDQNHGLGYNTDVNGPVLFGYGGGALGTKADWGENIALRWNADGNVAIGMNCIPADCKLAVNGMIRAKHVKVNTDTWCDYVFATDYNLMSIDELKQFIATHNHLPGVPSSEEVVEDGIDVGVVLTALLKRIEENTLYIISLKEEN